MGERYVSFVKVFVPCSSSIFTFPHLGGYINRKLEENSEEREPAWLQTGSAICWPALGPRGRAFGLRVGLILNPPPQVGVWMSRMIKLLISSLKTLHPKVFVKMFTS